MSQISGINAIAFYSFTIFTDIKMNNPDFFLTPTSGSILFSIGGLVGSFTTPFLISRTGRRFGYIGGQLIMGCLLILLGIFINLE
mmetsp:Transcript_87860/g.121065  ORF Transcript_87860/g.121065 Transcript_87860/m.121065 type:complete len:85 (-) Transcript_87860:496-750(-)